LSNAALNELFECGKKILVSLDLQWKKLKILKDIGLNGPVSHLENFIDISLISHSTKNAPSIKNDQREQLYKLSL
jgi:hypothetical protein